MPYPAPADVLAVSGLRWLLVAIPDDPAYGQAAIEQYARLADVWNWGLEGTHPDADEIRQQWLTAVDETLRALELGFPDTLLEILQVIRDNADEVEGLLRGLRDLSGCCDDTDPTGGDFYTDDWNDGDPVPQPIIDAGFAEDLNDQEGYTDYKCLIANVAVDDLIQKTLKWADLFDSAGNVVGGIAAVAAIAAGIIGVLTSAPAWIIAGGILAVTGNIARIYDWLTSTGESGVRTTADAFDAIRDDIVCAIYQADGMSEAVSAALAVLQGEVSAAVYAWASLVLPLTIKALYAGRYNEIDTAQALADAGFSVSSYPACDCEWIPQADDLRYRYALGSPGGVFNWSEYHYLRTGNAVIEDHPSYLYDNAYRMYFQFDRYTNGDWVCWDLAGGAANSMRVVITLSQSITTGVGAWPLNVAAHNASPCYTLTAVQSKPYSGDTRTGIQALYMVNQPASLGQFTADLSIERGTW